MPKHAWDWLRPVVKGSWRWLRGAGAVVLTVAAVEYGVIPAVAAARSQMSLLDTVVWPLLLVAAILEIASLAAYTQLTQVLLDPEERLAFGVQWRIDLIGYGLGRVVPGGGASASGLRIGLMVERGVSPPSTLALTVVQALMSALGLLAVWLLGALMSVPRTGVTTTSVVLLGGMVSAVAALELTSRAPKSGTVILKRLHRLRGLVPERWLGVVRTALARGIESIRDGKVTRRGVGWAAANWLLDATCLWICLQAAGASVALEVVIAAYGLVNAVALLPLTPGGIGVIEGLLIPALVAAGAPAGAAVFSVLAWRLLQYWLPVPVAGLCWLSLTSSAVPRRHVMGRWRHRRSTPT